MPPRHALRFALLALLPLLTASTLQAQGGLRASLERLDRNDNGVIEADEITPLARPFLERISRNGRSRMDLEDSHEIAELLEAARRYYASQNGASRGRPVRVDRDSLQTVLPFGLKPDEPQVPEFGLAEFKFRYTQDDLAFADRTLRSHDENKDGYIDRDEASRHEWTHRNPFADDLNKDDRLSRLEMAQRYARRRLLSGSAGELRKKSWRDREMSAGRKERREDPSQWWRRGGSDFWLTASLMSRFDGNRNGRLDPGESKNLGLPINRIDTDRDGDLTRDELFAYLKTEQNSAGGSAESAPDWFIEMDANRDGQIAMPEYATTWTDERLEAFAAMDSNGDGLVTVAEALRAAPAESSKYRNDETQLLVPRRTIISEIEIEEDIRIADLNVQLSITHTYVSTLDAFLTGPDGQRIELFTAVGGSDDHFDNTTFDDQAAESIAKSRGPFRGTYQPEGLRKGEPGLDYFNGKSAKGLWQLVVRGTRSERFGVLHGWKLQIAAEKADPDAMPAKELSRLEPQSPRR